MCWMFIIVHLMCFDLLEDIGSTWILRWLKLHRTGCLTRKSATNTVGKPRLERNHSPIMSNQWFFEHVMSILTFSAFCGPSASFRYVILKLIQSAWRNGMHITVCRSHSPTVYVVSQIGNPLVGTKEICFIIHSNKWQQQMDTNGTFRGLELGIVAESCALRRVWTPLWNFEKAQVWCLSKTPRKHWSIEAKRLIKS